MAFVVTGRAGVPVEPDRDLARRWAGEELAGREYRAARPSLLARLMSWLRERLQDLPVPDGPGSRLALLVVVLTVVGTVVYAVQRSGGLRRQVRVSTEAIFGDPTRTAADHRSTAGTAERDEDWRTAVVERFRAVTRELEERAVLVPHPGRTADEVALEAGSWLPDLADRLRHGAGVFDDVHYGDQPASADEATALRELDDAVRRARPVTAAVAPGGGLVAPS
jgi:hypothetical protein